MSDIKKAIANHLNVNYQDITKCQDYSCEWIIKHLGAIEVMKSRDLAIQTELESFVECVDNKINITEFLDDYCTTDNVGQYKRLNNSDFYFRWL
tara:strand:- start:90 stop:371 length:282 start_codon:yes stop_codon:yes gene_type:complete